MVKHDLQIGRQRSLQFQGFAGEWMDEAQLVGVQELPVKRRSFEDIARPIDRIGHYGMTDGFQVQANLVRAPGLQLQ